MKTKFGRVSARAMMAAGLLTGGSAMAADLPAMAPVMTQYNWSGVYVGVFGGSAYSAPDFHEGTVGYGTSSASIPFSESPTKYYGKPTIGGLGGGTIGFNWQNGDFVYGLEGDFAGVAQKTPGDYNVVYNAATDDRFANNYSQNVSAIGMIRGRLGLAFDRALIFATGGFAEVQTRYKYNDYTPGLFGSTANTNISSAPKTWVPAYVVGGGIEYALTNNWTIKAEGLYLGAQSTRKTMTPGLGEGGVPASPAGGEYVTVRTEPSQFLATIGINYKFGSGAMGQPSAMPTPQHNWSGVYLGAFGGGAYTDPNFDIGTIGYGYEAGDNVDNDVANKGKSAWGGLGGGTIGYNWQRGSLVYGLEADFAGVGQKAVFNNTFTTSTVPEYQDYTQNVSMIGTIRGRAGIAFDRTLVYLTGGLAEIADKYKYNYSLSPFFAGRPEEYGDSSSKTSWAPALAIGAGIEYALTDHLSIKAEGLYLAALPVKTVLKPGIEQFYGEGVDPTGGAYESVLSAPSQSIAKIGINYKF